jgi:hypothetical protein
MLRNCINRPKPGQQAVTPSRDRVGAHADTPDGRPPASGSCPLWRTPCQPRVAVPGYPSGRAGPGQRQRSRAAAPARSQGCTPPEQPVAWLRR